jgi:hypothetical protein
MTSNAGEGDGTLAPLLEAKVKLVVLDPCYTTDSLLLAVSIHPNVV